MTRQKVQAYEVHSQFNSVCFIKVWTQGNPVKVLQYPPNKMSYFTGAVAILRSGRAYVDLDHGSFQMRFRVSGSNVAPWTNQWHSDDIAV